MADQLPCESNHVSDTSDASIRFEMDFVGSIPQVKISPSTAEKRQSSVTSLAILSACGEGAGLSLSNASFSSSTTDSMFKTPNGLLDDASSNSSGGLEEYFTDPNSLRPSPCGSIPHNQNQLNLREAKKPSVSIPNDLLQQCIGENLMEYSAEETLSTLPGLRKTPQLMRKFAESGLVQRSTSANAGDSFNMTPLIARRKSQGFPRMGTMTKIEKMAALRSSKTTQNLHSHGLQNALPVPSANDFIARRRSPIFFEKKQGPSNQ